MCMMLSVVLSNLVAQLSNGLFLTSFLLLYDLDKSRIGILIFIPYMASLLNIFSPAILERFSKRKGILVGMKLFYYIVNILGVTLLPTLVQDAAGRVVGFIILVLIANIMNQLASSGWTAWQAEFLEKDVQVDYFQITNILQSSSGYVVVLVVSALGDAMAGTEYELILLTAVRYIAMVIAMADCLIWLVPREYPYVRKATIKISNIFKLSIKNKPYLVTVLMLALYSFAVNLPSATLNAYLLEDLGVNYSLVIGVSMLFFVFCIILSPTAKRIVNKYDYYRSFMMVCFGELISYILYAFVTPDTLWLFVLVRVMQHIIGALNVSVNNPIFYEVLPEEDRTNYLSFHTILINGAIFLSMMLGTLLAGILGDGAIQLFGYGFTSTQLCMLGCSVLLGCTILVLRKMEKMFGKKKSN